MKKKLVCVMSFALLAVALAVFRVTAASGVDYAYSVKGGEVTDADGFVEALTDANGNAHAEKVDENTIRIKNNLLLSAPINISAGSYTLLGNGSTLYRGFSNGPMIVLDGSEGSGGPSLTLETDIGDEEWDEQNFRLCIDGNSENYPDSEYGLIFVKGNVRLTVNGRVILKNSSTVTAGGGIYVEMNISEGVEKSPLSPTVTVSNARIINCSAKSAGGGIAFVGYSEEMNSGTLKVTNTVMTGDKSHNEKKTGTGGAIYTYGGEVEISNMTFSENSADNGGALYIASECKLSTLTFERNEALVDGGALYGAADNHIRCDIVLEDVAMTENKSGGDGGAVYNQGIMTSNKLMVSQNDSDGNGAGIYNSGFTELNEGSVMNNESLISGGGIYSSGKDSVTVLKSPSISSNKAKYCASVYSEGTLEFYSGTIENGNGEFPSVLIKGEITLYGKVSVVKDVIGLCVTEENGEKNYPYIKLEPSSGFYNEVTAAFCSEKTDKDGNVSGYRNVSKSKMLVVFGDEASMLETLENLSVKSRGLLSYKIQKTGFLSVRFVYLPVFVWVIIIVATAVTVSLIFRKKIVALIKKK